MPAGHVPERSGGDRPDGAPGVAAARAMTETTVPWLTLTVAMLATWRVSHLLVSEDGPADLIVRLRLYLANASLGRLMDCFGCVSLWVALPLALFVTRQPLEFVVVWLALSGGAMLLERTGPEPVIIESTPESSKGDQSDGMLR